MPNTRTIRLLIPCLATALLMAALMSAAARADTFGETLRFKGAGTGATKGVNFELQLETHAFGVDPTDNSIYVGDEKEEGSEIFRVQKYNAAGAFEASVLLKPAKVLPEGVKQVADIEGIAVDTSLKRVYVLVVYKRSFEDAVDPSEEEAGEVYAFSTTPSGGALVPAEGANAEGILVTPATMKASSEVQGESLLRPSGITVNPATDEIDILGKVDEVPGKESGSFIALDRFGSKGEAETRYVSPHALEGEEPHAPVITKAGQILFEDQDQIRRIPSNLTSAPETIYQLGLGGFTEGDFHRELLVIGEAELEEHYGGELSILPENGTEGRLVVNDEVQEMNEAGEVPHKFNGALVLKYKEAEGKVVVSDVGWTGGQGPDELGKAHSCEVGFGGEDAPQIAAGKEEKVFILTSATSEVIEFGPGGEKCPTAKGIGAIEGLVAGAKVTKVEAGEAVTLAARVQEADVLSVEWTFGDGTNKTTETTAGTLTQVAETSHKFAKSGKVTVEATIHTDNLQTPVVKMSGTLQVEEGPTITLEPKSTSVEEGQNTEFKAAATGEPAPAVKWEVAKSKGGAFTAVAGATNDTLVLTNVPASQNGWEYRASFSNGYGAKESFPTKAAVLTVTSIPGPPLKSSPSSVNVREPEGASFEASAESATGVQWEESTNGGSSWTAIAGATTDRYAIASTKQSESGHEFRANFVNAQKGHTTSVAATLTVRESVAAENERLQREAAEKAKAEAEARAKAEAEARARAEAEAKVRHEGEEALALKPVLSGATLATTSKGAVTVKISCPAGASRCTGTLTLKTASAVVARSKAKILTLATGSYSVAGGQSAIVTLHLSAAGRKLLGKSRSLRTRLTFADRNPGGGSATIIVGATLKLTKKR